MLFDDEYAERIARAYGIRKGKRLIEYWYLIRNFLVRYPIIGICIGVAVTMLVMWGFRK